MRRRDFFSCSPPNSASFSHCGGQSSHHQITLKVVFLQQRWQRHCGWCWSLCQPWVFLRIALRGLQVLRCAFIFVWLQFSLCALPAQIDWFHSALLEKMLYVYVGLCFVHFIFLFLQKLRFSWTISAAATRSRPALLWVFFFTSMSWYKSQLKLRHTKPLITSPLLPISANSDY